MKFIKGLKEVFSKPKYLILMILSAFLFYLLSVIISDFREFISLFTNYSFPISIKLFFNYFFGFHTTITNYSAVSMVLISLLFGCYLSLAIYKTTQLNSIKDKKSLLGSVGVFLGLFAPGCAACGIGLASLFGLGGFLITLPFKGNEISAIAILLLSYANWIIARKINKNSCSI